MFLLSYADYQRSIKSYLQETFMVHQKRVLSRTISEGLSRTLKVPGERSFKILIGTSFFSESVVNYFENVHYRAGVQY